MPTAGSTADGHVGSGGERPIIVGGAAPVARAAQFASPSPRVRPPHAQLSRYPLCLHRTRFFVQISARWIKCVLLCYSYFLCVSESFRTWPVSTQSPRRPTPRHSWRTRSTYRLKTSATSCDMASWREVSGPSHYYEVCLHEFLIVAPIKQDYDTHSLELLVV